MAGARNSQTETRVVSQRSINENQVIPIPLPIQLQLQPSSSSRFQGNGNNAGSSNNPQSMAALLQQVQAVCQRQDIVLNQLDEIRAQNRHFQVANDAMVAMNETQARFVRELFATYMPSVEADVRAFHEAQAVAAQREAQITNRGMWETFQSWSTWQKVIFAVVAVGLTAVAGFFAWKFISFLWPKIVAFIAEYGPKLLEKIENLATIVTNSPIFAPLSDALRDGTVVDILRCTQQLLEWQNLFTILALFLGYQTSTGNNRNNCR